MLLHAPWHMDAPTVIVQRLVTSTKVPMDLRRGREFVRLDSCAGKTLWTRVALRSQLYSRGACLEKLGSTSPRPRKERQTSPLRSSDMLGNECSSAGDDGSGGGDCEQMRPVEEWFRSGRTDHRLVSWPCKEQRSPGQRHYNQHCWLMPN